MFLYMEKKYTVYVHTFPDGKMYFGKTSQDVMRRWRSDGSGYKHINTPMWQAIQKYGWNNITHSILKTGLSDEEAAALETHYIEEYQSNNPLFGYNRSIGYGTLGLCPPNKGRHHTDETKRKMSLAAKKGVPKPKFKWLTPDGSIREMDITTAKRYHPDWKQID